MVISSVDELEKLSGKKVEEPHIPWIDEITIERDGKTYRRVPDVLDVWVDAGTASWNSLNFPQNKEEFEKNFPADFILEGKDQIRGWFNLLHVASMIAFGKSCFKAVFMHGFVQDSQGRKMSKSLGNYILPEEVVAKYGADTLRYYMIGGTGAGIDINYNFEDMKVKHKHLMVLWNIHKYILELAKSTNVDLKKIEIDHTKLSVEEKYILSKLHSTIKKTTETFDGYRLNETPSIIEHLFLELSRTYLQLTREKASVGKEEERKLVFYVTFEVFMDTLRLLTPIAPFITEKIYQNFKEVFKFEEESIHLMKWPSWDKAFINQEMEDHMGIVQLIVQVSLAAREKMHLGVRWPINELIITTKDEKVKKAIDSLSNIIKTQINVKNVSVKESLPGIKISVKPDYSKLGPKFGKDSAKVIAQLILGSPEVILRKLEKGANHILKIDNKEFEIVKEDLMVERVVPEKYLEGSFKDNFVYLDKELTDELESEGFSREIMRRVQSLRKKSGLQKSDTINLFIKVEKDLTTMVGKWKTQIKEKVGAKVIIISENNPEKQHAHSSKEKVRKKEFELFFDVM